MQRHKNYEINIGMLIAYILLLFVKPEDELDAAIEKSDLKGREGDYGMDNKLLSEIERLVNEYNVFVNNLTNKPEN